MKENWWHRLSAHINNKRARSWHRRRRSSPKTGDRSRKTEDGRRETEVGSPETPGPEGDRKEETEVGSQKSEDRSRQVLTSTEVDRQEESEDRSRKTGEERFWHRLKEIVRRNARIIQNIDNSPVLQYNNAIPLFGISRNLTEMRDDWSGKSGVRSRKFGTR